MSMGNGTSHSTLQEQKYRDKDQGECVFHTINGYAMNNQEKPKKNQLF
jgi:hypothetical protein